MDRDYFVFLMMLVLLFCILGMVSLYKWFSISRANKKEADKKAADSKIMPHDQTTESIPYWIGERLEHECVQKKLYLQPDLNVDILAMQIGTNRTYISRYLASIGLTYYSYINTLRVEYAKKLIAEKEETKLSQIARKSGFRSDNTFRRAFVEVEKCTPSDYIKQQKIRDKGQS